MAAPSGTAPCSRPGSELRSLTGLRALGALAVFGFHTTGYGDRLSGYWRLADPGFSGVSLFFILSGFVLTLSPPPGNDRFFYRRRFARIYPTYISVGVVVALLYLAWGVPESALGLGLSVFLLQSWYPATRIAQSGNGVGWSLSCEAFFYGLFPFLRRRLATTTVTSATRLVIGYWLVCSGILVFFSLALGGRYDINAYESPPLRLADFLVGMCLAHRVTHSSTSGVSRRWAWLAVAILWALCVVIDIHAHRSSTRGLTLTLMTPGFCLLIAGYARVDLRRASTLLAHPTMHYLGRISYAFYLVHQAVAGAVGRYVVKDVATLDEGLVRALLSLLITLGLTALVHHVLELPAQRLIVARTLSRPTGAP